VDLSSDGVVEHRVVDEVLDELFDESRVAANLCCLDVCIDVKLAVVRLLALGVQDVDRDRCQVEVSWWSSPRWPLAIESRAAISSSCCWVAAMTVW
jgi:hypothetical protein